MDVFSRCVIILLITLSIFFYNFKHCNKYLSKIIFNKFILSELQYVLSEDFTNGIMCRAVFLGFNPLGSLFVFWIRYMTFHPNFVWHLQRRSNFEVLSFLSNPLGMNCCQSSMSHLSASSCYTGFGGVLCLFKLGVHL